MMVEQVRWRRHKVHGTWRQHRADINDTNHLSKEGLYARGGSEARDWAIPGCHVEADSIKITGMGEDAGSYVNTNINTNNDAMLG